MYPSTSCSPWRVRHGSTTILDYSDLVAAPPALTAAGQQVQTVPVVRGLLPFTAPRGSEQHSLRLERIREHATQDAMWQALRDEASADDLPRGRDTVTIETQAGLVVTMAKAIIESWPARPHDGTATVSTLTIRGGEVMIVAVSAVVLTDDAGALTLTDDAGTSILIAA